MFCPALWRILMFLPVRISRSPLLQVSRRFCIEFLHVSLSWFQTFAVFWMLYDFFWVIPLRLNFICRLFGTPCLFHLHLTGRCPWIWSRQSVPKRRHIKFRRRVITQKKTYDMFQFIFQCKFVIVFNLHEIAFVEC